MLEYLIASFDFVEYHKELKGLKNEAHEIQSWKPVIQNNLKFVIEWLDEGVAAYIYLRKSSLRLMFDVTLSEGLYYQSSSKSSHEFILILWCWPEDSKMQYKRYSSTF